MKKGPMNLEAVIGSKTKVSLLRFLANAKDWQFNLTEVSKSIGTDKGALSRLIKELELSKVIEVKRSGKLLLFRLNEQNKFSQIITSLGHEKWDMNLESVIGSKAKVSLLRFLANAKDWQFNLASIAKAIGTYKGALSRLIKELESKKILEVKHSGKLILFRLNEQNKFSSLIKELFEKEAKLR